jgi:hypothetical protein
MKKMIAVSVTLLLLVNMAHADRIILKTGDVYDGKIIDTDGHVQIEVDGLIYEIAKEGIERIVVSPENEEPPVRVKAPSITPSPVDNTSPPTTQKKSSSGAGIITVASAAITGVLLTVNNTKKTQDDAAARQAQANANLSAAFGGASRTVDSRLYETEEERFNSAVIVMISLGVGVIVGAILSANSSSIGETNAKIRPYFGVNDSISLGLAISLP